MPIRQKVVAIIIAVSILIIIFELVRRRKLREEYSWIWLMTGAIIVTLTIWYGLLVRITHIIGAMTPVSALFFFAFIFLLLVCLQFSVRISKLTNQVITLTQELTIMKSKEERKSQQVNID